MRAIEQKAVWHTSRL